MAKVLSIVNQKGGVGKTTTAVTLGHGLAMAGKRVLLVDLDSQGNVADALGMDKTDALYRFLTDRVGDEAIAHSGREHGRERLDVILSNKTTLKAKHRLVEMNFREYQLKRALSDVGDAYDAIILDIAPGTDILQISALVAADVFLIPVALGHLAVVGAADALGTVASLKEVGAFSGTFLGVLPTMWERTTKESHEQFNILAQQFGHMVWPPIPLDVKAREAPGFGQTLWEYAPKTRALTGVELRSGKRVGGYAEVLARLLKEIPW